MSSVKLSLMCIVWPRLNDSEKPDEDTFEVKIDNDETIASLKDLIKLKCAPKFDKFIAVDLVLWKCSIPADDDLQESLNTIRFDGTNTRFGLLRLPPICKISEYFATGLPSKTIHILVKRPDYDTHLEHAEVKDGKRLPSLHRSPDDCPPSKRARRGEKLLPSHALHKLWLLRKQSNTKSFIVQRKSKDTHASSTYWVMTQQDGINELLDFGSYGGLSGILIREEYTEAFMAAIEFSETGKANRLTESEVADDETEESYQSKTGVHDSYSNPFSNISATLPARRGGFILIGHPGIGKTVWLIAMLILRLQAGLPTIYQSMVDRMYLFNDEGVFEFPCGQKGDPDWTEVKSYDVPATTWALIDSNENLIHVPISYSRLFVVQATSPRPDRFAWRDKAPFHVTSYIMKPWTISELHLGRTLQQIVCSEEEVTTFFNLFGPSARSVYANASYVEEYESNLLAKIGGITNTKDLEIIFWQAAGLNLSKDITHQIALISPGAFRYVPDVLIPTKHIFEMLCDQFSERIVEAAARVSNIHSGIDTPFRLYVG